MDRLSFVFSLLLIISFTTITFGSVIKAKNLNGKVKNRLILLPMFKHFVCNNRGCLSLTFHGMFGPF